MHKHAHACTRKHADTRTRTHAHLRTCEHIHVRAHSFTQKRTYTLIHAHGKHARAHMQACTHTYTHTYSFNQLRTNHAHDMHRRVNRCGCTLTYARKHSFNTHAYPRALSVTPTHTTHLHTQRVVELAAAVRVGVAIGALAGVNGLRVLSKAGATLRQCVLRHGQPAQVDGLDPVDWAYVLTRRANTAPHTCHHLTPWTGPTCSPGAPTSRTHMRARLHPLARSIEYRPPSPFKLSFKRVNRV